jgi:hypothetical protein
MTTHATIERCPTCGSSDPNTAASSCYNAAWHRGDVVHLQHEPIGTPGSQCSATCGAAIDDPPSQIAVDREFVTCPACYRETIARKVDDILPGLGTLVRQTTVTQWGSSIRETSNEDEHWSGPAKILHQELSDNEIDRTTLEGLRAAYRSLRDHHVAETTALAQRRDDLTRRRDDQLARSQEILAESQRLLASADTIMASADTIMRRDEKTIDQITSESARLSEIVDFMRDHYSPIGGRSCALCVYEDGRFIRPCAVHRWDDSAAKILASRVADPEDPTMLDYLSDKDLAGWMERAGLNDKELEGTYLRTILTELRERRDAEAIFIDADLQLQAIADCATCADDLHELDHEHRSILRRWQIAQGALCALARIHRGYLQSLREGSDPR